MEQVTQQRAPLLEAMQAHLVNRVVRFDVPGHKGGRGNHELAEFLGADCVRMDVNSHEKSGQSLSSGFRYSGCPTAGSGSVRCKECILYHQRGNGCITGNDFLHL